MRIVHAIARLNLGGAALSVLELAAAQNRLGHQVLVVAGRVPEGEESMEDMAGTLGVDYRHVAALQRELSVTSDLRAIGELRAILRERRPDVLHTHTAKAGATGRIAARLAGRGRPRALVHTFHGHVLSGYFDSRHERVFRSVERRLARTTDALVAVSDEVRDDLLRLGIAPLEKFAVVPYGFDLDARVRCPPEARARTRAQLGVPESTFVLGWIGRLTAIKNPLDLVRLAAALGAGSALVLVGDGEDRPAVESLARELAVADRVHLVGYQPEIAGWYAAFDALVLTSANEGTPVVAIEALAAGLPVAATDAGGTSTVVDDGETGFLVPVGDVEQLAERVRRLAADPDLRARMGELGAARARERFSTARMVDDVERLYRRILGT